MPADEDFRDFLETRNQALVAAAQFLRAEVEPEGGRRLVTRKFAALLISLCRDLPDSAELTAAARLLLAARDGFVRATLLDLYTDED